MNPSSGLTATLLAASAEPSQLESQREMAALDAQPISHPTLEQALADARLSIVREAQEVLDRKVGAFHVINDILARELALNRSVGEPWAEHVGKVHNDVVRSFADMRRQREKANSRQQTAIASLDLGLEPPGCITVRSEVARYAESRDAFEEFAKQFFTGNSIMAVTQAAEKCADRLAKFARSTSSICLLLSEELDRLVYAVDDMSAAKAMCDVLKLRNAWRVVAGQLDVVRAGLVMLRQAFPDSPELAKVLELMKPMPLGLMDRCVRKFFARTRQQASAATSGAVVSAAKPSVDAAVLVAEQANFRALGWLDDNARVNEPDLEMARACARLVTGALARPVSLTVDQVCAQRNSLAELLWRFNKTAHNDPTDLVLNGAAAFEFADSCKTFGRLIETRDAVGLRAAGRVLRGDIASVFETASVALTECSDRLEVLHSHPTDDLEQGALNASHALDMYHLALAASAYLDMLPAPIQMLGGMLSQDASPMLRQIDSLKQAIAQCIEPLRACVDCFIAEPSLPRGDAFDVSKRA